MTTLCRPPDVPGQLVQTQTDAIRRRHRCDAKLWRAGGRFDRAAVNEQTAKVGSLWA